jgi:hypothetical protein
MNLKRGCLAVALLAVHSLAAVAQTQPLPAFDALPVQEALPDPFLMLDGTRVTTPQQWNEQRRPELKRLFQHYMYGYIPPAPEVQFEVVQEDRDVFGGAATLKQITISFPQLPENAPRIHLALFVPNESTGPVSTFLVVNKCGNHTVADDPRLIINPSAVYHKQCPPDVPRGFAAAEFTIENTIKRGYAFATYHESDIDPDVHDFTDGIHPFYKDLPGSPENHWGTIGAWAWGLHRCVDYLVTDGDIESKRIIVTGHSRRGKTALFAGAMDERIGMVIPHQSGTGGMALSRGNDQETLAKINKNFPHWFNDAFTKFDGNENKLPIDQHLLVALVAPRPLMDIGGLQDKWANYESALRNLKAVDPVYKLLGAEGLKGEGMVMDGPLTADNTGTIVQFRRDTAHDWDLAYWNAMIDFANLQWAK